MSSDTLTQLMATMHTDFFGDGQTAVFRLIEKHQDSTRRMERHVLKQLLHVAGRNRRASICYRCWTLCRVGIYFSHNKTHIKVTPSQPHERIASDDRNR